MGFPEVQVRSEATLSELVRLVKLSETQIHCICVISAGRVRDHPERDRAPGPACTACEGSGAGGGRPGGGHLCAPRGLPGSHHLGKLVGEPGPERCVRKPTPTHVLTRGEIWRKRAFLTPFWVIFSRFCPKTRYLREPSIWSSRKVSKIARFASFVAESEPW